MRVGGKKPPEYPQFEPMADNAITWGGIRGLGFSLCIYEWLLNPLSNQLDHELKPWSKEWPLQASLLWDKNM